MSWHKSCSTLLAAAACLLAGDSSTHGHVISQTSALRLGLTRAWYQQIEVSRDGGRLNHITQHGGALYIQTSSSVITVLDAETGRFLWSRQIGSPGMLTTAPGVGEKHLAIVTGTVLHILDPTTGRVLWERDIHASAGAGPVVSQKHVWVPTLTGMLIVYKLDDPDELPWRYQSAGRILTQPLATLTSVIWTAERGFLYVAQADPPSIRLRLETSAPIESRPAFWTPYVYAGSVDGYLFAVDETRGNIKWKFPTGLPIRVAPVAIADRVFVAAERSGMYCLTAKTGDQQWFAPGVTQLLALSDARVYAFDEIDRLVVLDAKSGTPQTSVQLGAETIKVTNNQTDRIYLATSQGEVQCLREIGQQAPLKYAAPAIEKPLAKKVKAAGEKGAKAKPTEKHQPAKSGETPPAKKVAPESTPKENAPGDEANPFG